MKNKGVEQYQGMRLKKNKIASTSKRKPFRPPPPSWLELPEDITAKILLKLGPVEILWTAQYVCTTWRKICRDPTMWPVIDMWKLDNDGHKLSYSYDGKEFLCRLAVELSEGQVTEINIEEFGSDHLLQYIAERCSNLRCLRLAFCEDVSGKTLSKAIKGFPLLEVLHLQCTPVSKDDIEAIGQSCPMLKSFALNGFFKCQGAAMESNEEALAVATFMPELRHLQLFGNRMTNEVLDTILNGCPKLESLDLRHCFNLDMELGKRYAQRVKILRGPNDSTHDYEWETKDFDWDSDGLDSYIDSDDDYEYDDVCDPYHFFNTFG